VSATAPSGAGGTRQSRADSATGELPRRHWPAGEVPFRLVVPPVGVLLGLDARGGTAVFPLLVPSHSTRVEIVGEPYLAHLLILRLLAQSCDLTVVTARPEPWARIAAGMPATPFTITDHVQRWPAANVPGPWALLIDMPDPPQTSFARTPWSTVIHLVPAVPSGSGWWQSANLILTTRAYAASVSPLRPRLEPAMAEQLAQHDVLAVEHDSVTVFQLAPTQHEHMLLAGVGRPSIEDDPSSISRSNT
jgi:hypothetical protein